MFLVVVLVILLSSLVVDLVSYSKLLVTALVLVIKNQFAFVIVLVLVNYNKKYLAD